MLQSRHNLAITRRDLPLQALESRAMLSVAPWNDASGLMGQDQLADLFPTINGAGQVVAIIDTGIDYTNPRLGGGFGPGFKVIAGHDFVDNDSDPRDTNGHGTHTASTVAGNVVTAAATPAPVLPPGFTYISGVAPCAKIRSYKTCPGTSCPGADIQAGMNSVLLHGDADVMNFSISGGTSPWVDNDRRKLDLVDAGVFVAASAGNTSASVPNPVGNVNHRGPWVLSVAASTHDAQSSALISASGPGTPPGNTQNIPASKGSESPNASSATNLPIRRFTGQPEAFEGCTAGVDGAPADLPAFPAGFFNGAAALISRGTCPFTTKITNAFNAGAALVLIRNNQAAAFSMNTAGQPNVPAYSIEQAPGNALRDFVTANPTDATINADVVNGDVLAGFSLRGPTPAPLADLTKPDITAPGVSIYAAYTGAAGYGSLSGTSMSGPHAAGSALLIKQVQPTWTDAEIKSALMMTAKKAGRKDNIVSTWDWDDVGSGRVDLTKAARAGLVMHETTANYLAANPARVQTTAYSNAAAGTPSTYTTDWQAQEQPLLEQLLTPNGLREAMIHAVDVIGPTQTHSVSFQGLNGVTLNNSQSGLVGALHAIVIDAVMGGGTVGTVIESRKIPHVERVYGAYHGVSGILKEDFIDLTRETTHNLEMVGNTPTSGLGSTRDKPDAAYCEKVLAGLKRAGADAFIYIGGNDTAGTQAILADAAGGSRHQNFFHEHLLA